MATGVDVTAGISGAAKDDLLDGRPVPGLYVFISVYRESSALSPLSFPSFFSYVGSLLSPTGLSTCSERCARVARNGLDASSLHLYVVKSQSLLSGGILFLFHFFFRILLNLNLQRAHLCSGREVIVVV